jgi:hypothetical protein
MNRTGKSLGSYTVAKPFFLATANLQNVKSPLFYWRS